MPLDYEDSIELRYTYSREPLVKLLDSNQLIAGVTFCDDGGIDDDPRLINSGLQTFSQSSPVTEVWYSDKPVSCGFDHDIRWSCSDDTLFTALYINESDYPDLRSAAYDAYCKLLRFVNQRGYPHILRAWNYMAEINKGEGDNERYKQFCHGRYDAFSSEEYIATKFPAACALGHHAGRTVIYWLSSKQAAIHFENPRQLSAYQYPREYGIRSPSFARASVAKHGVSKQLYLSGTASIIGHQSYFPGDVDQQLRLTMENIKILLNSIGEYFAESAPTLDLIKIYLRHAKHFQQVDDVLQHLFPKESYLIVEADICRSDLLVEIDGICHW